jgi:hypothetical protein
VSMKAATPQLIDVATKSDPLYHTYALAHVIESTDPAAPVPVM